MIKKKTKEKTLIDINYDKNCLSPHAIFFLIKNILNKKNSSC